MGNAIDLHIHTTASDGSDSPALLLENLKAAGIRIFAVTDHDTLGALEAIRALTPPELCFIPGIEFSCITPRGKCHILGYRFDPEDSRIAAALAEGARLRREKLETRLRGLESNFGITLTSQEQQWLRSQSSPGKPHLGKILANRGLAADVNSAIRRYINPIPTPGDRIDARLAIDAILHAGGIPVWAHPLGGEGERPLPPGQFDAQLETLTAMGIRGLECHYSRYSSAQRHFLLSQARKKGLLVSGGSDYHGSNKTDLPLGRLSADNAAVTQAELTILDALL